MAKNKSHKVPITHKGQLVKYRSGNETSREDVRLCEYPATYKIVGTKLFFSKVTGCRTPYSAWYQYRLENVTTLENKCPKCGEKDNCRWDDGKCWTCGYCNDNETNQENV